MSTVLVNTADWDGPADIPAGWVIANAPRPILGERRWADAFRHGTFYAASPQPPAGSWGWAADDAWLVEFIDDAEIERRVMAKAAEYGDATREAMEADGITVAMIAESLQLPWRGEA